MNIYIESDSSGLVVLDTVKYASAYSHLERIKNQILNSPEIKHKHDFSWKTRIIHNDSVVNAFATPGGYIYVFTGLIKYLDNEDQFAGVLAHEIAHADLRHSTAMLTKVYGLNLLMNIVLGSDNQAMSQITHNLLSLNFSRGAEEEADRYSVIYLCHPDSPYRANGTAGFFEKMMSQENSGFVPEFLSSHPNPPNRIRSIEKIVKELNCTPPTSNTGTYNAFKNSLPQ